MEDSLVTDVIRECDARGVDRQVGLKVLNTLLAESEARAGPPGEAVPRDADDDLRKGPPDRGLRERAAQARRGGTQLPPAEGGPRCHLGGLVRLQDPLYGDARDTRGDLRREGVPREEAPLRGQGERADGEPGREVRGLHGPLDDREGGRERGRDRAELAGLQGGAAVHRGEGHLHPTRPWRSRGSPRSSG